MERRNIFNWAMMVALFVFAIGCQEEPVGFTGGAPCPDCNAGGDVLDQDPKCRYAADLEPWAFTINSLNSDVFDYTIEIKNVGGSTATISNSHLAVYQGWLSTDGVSRDQPACGTTFNDPLLPGEIYTDKMSCTFNGSVNVKEFSFFILEVGAEAGVGECNKANNTKAFPL